MSGRKPIKDGGEEGRKNPIYSEITFTIFYTYFTINAGASKMEQT